MTNPADVIRTCLYNHVIQVASNFKKALSLVTSPDCPYKDKTFPYGHNWIDYLEWVKNNFMEVHSKVEREVEEVENVNEDDNEDEDVSVSADPNPKKLTSKDFLLLLSGDILPLL